MLNSFDDTYAKELSELLVKSFDFVNQMEKGRLKGVKNVDLSINELHLLEAIGMSEEGSSVREIALALEITMPSVTVATNKLEKKGLLIKIPDKNDKRVVRVVLTQLGRKFNLAHEYFHIRMIRSILSQLQEEDKPTFMNAIRNLHAFLEKNSADIANKL
ncbi:MarR family transcriptional regulator [Bacteroidales bacterium OttesenSCG-928-B11]|nr:MarR family transcriptional regulator [Bacteroidales bacterium OttesenSCG-928-C03]MDL2312636.1 MarR family transcriptional regulator [Bacteroidales bacterium OttesenSCG-928-B11]MDL2326106.1 MarR family transcriptional regulator [Bacteroidales bacterium OttesenSCG-928-A14]